MLIITLRALVLPNSYASWTKPQYAHGCAYITWREQFQFSCKMSVEFSASSFCFIFGNVKIISNNPNPTSSLCVLQGAYIYIIVIRRSEFFISGHFKNQAKRFPCVLKLLHHCSKNSHIESFFACITKAYCYQCWATFLDTSFNCYSNDCGIHLY